MEILTHTIIGFVLRKTNSIWDSWQQRRPNVYSTTSLPLLTPKTRNVVYTINKIIQETITLVITDPSSANALLGTWIGSSDPERL